MSFVMTHLAIAKEINDQMGIAKNLPSYFLGTIAPDSVHVRSDYHSDMKKIAHFCPGDEGWGRITDNQEWRDRTLGLLQSYRNHPDFDFMLGYFIHILVDTYDNEKIHIPFKEKYAQLGLPPEERGRVFYNDKSQNDFALFNHYPYKDELWKTLRDSKGIDVENVIKASEADQYRELILHQFDSGVCSYDQPVRFFTLDDNMKFIGETSGAIIRLLSQILGR